MNKTDVSVKTIEAKIVPIIHESADITPMGLLQMAVESNADLDRLEKLMGMQERWEGNQARKEYIKALSEFKKSPPEIRKDKKNDQYNSWYTSIGGLVNSAAYELSKHGIKHSWDTTQKDGVITITCTLTHVMGHSESTSMSGPPDDSGKKNTLQQIKSTKTYLKIATFEDITGLVSSEGNTDDDGNGAEALDVDAIIQLFESSENMAKLSSRATHAAKLKGDARTKAQDAYKKRKQELTEAENE